MKGLRLDLVATVGAANLQLWMVSSGTGGALGVAIGLVFTLVLPGYVVLAVLHAPQRYRLSPAEHVAFAIPLSMAIVAVTGLVLNEAGFGIDAFGQALALSVLICVTACVAMLSWSEPSLDTGVRQAGLAAGIVITALVVGSLAVYIGQEVPASSLSLYVVGSDGSVGTIPAEVVFGDTVSLSLGVDYAGPGEAAFTLETPAGPLDVHVRDGHGWQQIVSLVLPRRGVNDLEFRLVPADSTETARSVIVRILAR